MNSPSAVLPPPTHREYQPVNRCMKCGCYLRSGNTSTTCDPCGTPEWEELDVESLTVGDVMAAASQEIGKGKGTARRRGIFDALLECMEEAA